MKFLRRMAAAVMLYSRIPVPKAFADGKDMEGAIMFLPLIGYIIAALMYALTKITALYDIPVLLDSLVLTLHLDY